ncbi:RluA family pseudouridine synthase [Paenibacillus sp. GCM10027626]|uniref:RluA family pseudouridine synthase n=1 Tax=Paenibacillus sp. GCM10027626 TaxID=3273411 RepID=UPI00362C76AE
MLTGYGVTSGSQPLPILYEDNHLLAVIKPPGILSQADQTGEPDMVNLLKEDLKFRYRKPGNVFVGLVHRLDRPVGGAMLFAKTSKAAGRLSDSVRTRSFDKVYFAIVHGMPAPCAEPLRHYLRKDAGRNLVTVHDHPVPDAKEALLYYEVVASARHTSLVAVRLLTGRPHQIRAQMSAIGHPLLFDRKYGAPAAEGARDLALWSAAISVPHPVTKEQLILQAPLPAAEPWRQWQDSPHEEAMFRLLGARAKEKQ